jgi:integrase/recombinase XerC
MRSERGILVPIAAPEILTAAPPDPVALLLADKRSPATRRAYAADLADFFGGPPHPAAVEAFVRQAPDAVAQQLAAYKGRLIARALSEATVNRRLSAVRSLLKFCHRLGYAQTDGRGLVDGEKSRAYRDTRGIGLAALGRLIQAPAAEGVAGLRDRALLRLLAENALRRAEVVGLDVADFQPAERRIMVRGKGRGTEQEPMTLSPAAAGALAAYLGAAGHTDGALFRNRDRRTAGGRLTTKSLRELVRRYGEQIGVADLAPHKLRHSAITAALDLTGGDVRRVQKLSRHRRLETLLIYDDNRSDVAGELAGMLSGALGG